MTRAGRRGGVSDDPSNDSLGLPDKLEKVRKELTATRIAAFGFLLVVSLSLYGARRIVVLSALLVVLLVVFFLGCRCGLGDTELSLRQSIGATLVLAAVFFLLMLWGGR